MLIVSFDSDDRRLLDSSDESDASDDMDNSSDDNNASDDIDMALNFFCLSIGDTKGRCLLIKGRNFKSLFFDAEMCHCHSVTCQNITNAHFFRSETVVCMFICASFSHSMELQLFRACGVSKCWREPSFESSRVCVYDYLDRRQSLLQCYVDRAGRR